MKISQVIQHLEHLKNKEGDLDIHTWMQHEDGTHCTMPMTTPLTPGWAFRLLDYDTSWMRETPIGWRTFFLALEEAIRRRKENQFVNPEVFLELFSPEMMENFMRKREEL